MCLLCLPVCVSPNSSCTHSCVITCTPLVCCPHAAAAPKPDVLSPTDTIVWGGKLPSTKRAAMGGMVATAIALGGNLGGITSWLFSLDGGQLAAALRADIVVPVQGFKRCYDAGYGFGEQELAMVVVARNLSTRQHQWLFSSIAALVCHAGVSSGGIATHGSCWTRPAAAHSVLTACPSPVLAFLHTEFKYPSNWLADQTLYFRAAQRAEAARSLDPPALRKPRARQVIEPSAAFGPPGSRCGRGTTRRLLSLQSAERSSLQPVQCPVWQWSEGCLESSCPCIKCQHTVAG